MDALISGLIVAAVTGLAFIAYKHPRGYQRLFALISALGGAVMFLLVGYVYGRASYVAGYLQQALKDSPASTLKSAESVINSLATALDSMGHGLLIVAIVWGYLVFLAYLPKLLAEDKKPAQSDAASSGADEASAVK